MQVTFKSHYGGFLFDMTKKDFFSFLDQDESLKEMWLKDIGYVENIKYYIEKERQGYSNEEQFLKIHKWINDKLWLPKATFYLSGSVFLALLADNFGLSFDFQDCFLTKKDWKGWKLKGIEFYPHQEKVISSLINPGKKQIDLIKEDFKELVNKRFTYANFSVPEAIVSVKKYFPFLERDIYSGFVISPARSGKTIMMLGLAQRMGLKTLIIVDKDLIFNQFKDRIKAFTDLQDEDVVFYKGASSFGKNKNNIIGIGMIQTLATLFSTPDKKKIEIIKRELSTYDLVIVDEAHSAATSTFIAALSGIHYCKIFGFTATRMRGDGNIRLLDYYIGRIITEIKQNEVGDMVYNIDIYPRFITHYKDRVLGFKKLKKTRTGYVESINKWAVKNLYNDSTRNNIILNDIKKAINAGRLVIVIGETLDHLGYLASEINRKFGKGKNIAYFINSKTKKKEREEILEKFTQAGKDRAEGNDYSPKVLLATASLLGKGFDGPYFDTIFLVAPIGAKKKERGDDGRAGLVQVVNRIGNKVKGKKQPICIDYIDIEPERVLVNMARSRFWNVYKDRYGDLKHNFRIKGDWSLLLNK